MPLRDKTCTSEGCDRPGYCKGMCTRCYRRHLYALEHPDVHAIRRCSLDNCQEKHHALGLCRIHYVEKHDTAAARRDRRRRQTIREREQRQAERMNREQTAQPLDGSSVISQPKASTTTNRKPLTSEDAEPHSTGQDPALEKALCEMAACRKEPVLRGLCFDHALAARKARQTA